MKLSLGLFVLPGRQAGAFWYWKGVSQGALPSRVIICKHFRAGMGKKQTHFSLHLRVWHYGLEQSARKAFLSVWADTFACHFFGCCSASRKNAICRKQNLVQAGHVLHSMKIQRIPLQCRKDCCLRQEMARIPQAACP